MRRIKGHSDEFPFVIVLAIWVLVEIGKASFGDLLKAWAAKELARLGYGDTAMSVISQLAEYVPAMTLAALVVVVLYRYIRRDFQKNFGQDGEAHRVPQTGNLILLPSRHYSAKNREDFSDRLDKISNVLNTAGESIFQQAEIALNISPWDRPGEKLAPFVDRMSQIGELSLKMRADLYEEILGKERDYRVEMNKILFPIEPIIDFQREAAHFFDGLSVWTRLRDTESSRDQLLQLVHASRMSFGIARDRFLRWVEEREALLAQARRELRQ